MNMKMNVTSKVHLDQRLLAEIHTEVKETLAVDVELATKKQRSFCAADMWNIHRQRRLAPRRKFL